MLGIDSSVIVRYLTHDDEEQAKAATALLEHELTAEQPGWITIGALLETIWVLRRSYRYPADQVKLVIERLLTIRNLFVDERDAVERALARPGEGLADAIIHELGAQAGCTETVTFDRGFARLQGVRLLA